MFLLAHFDRLVALIADAILLEFPVWLVPFFLQLVPLFQFLHYELNATMTRALNGLPVAHSTVTGKVIVWRRPRMNLIISIKKGGVWFEDTVEL